MENEPSNMPYQLDLNGKQITDNEITDKDKNEMDTIIQAVFKRGTPIEFGTYFCEGTKKETLCFLAGVKIGKQSIMADLLKFTKWSSDACDFATLYAPYPNLLLDSDELTLRRALNGHK